MQRKRYPLQNTIVHLARWSKVQISSLKDCSFQEKKNPKNPSVKKGLNYTVMTNNAIKKLPGSLVFTQELSEAEMFK